MPCDWIVGPVERIDGEIHLTLFLPCGPSPSEAVAFPASIIDPPDGPLDLPRDLEPVIEEEADMWTPDPATIITAEHKAAAAQESLLAIFSGAIQPHLDATARERQHDGIQTAVSYRDDPNGQFAAEATALFAWRSAVWTYATAELGKVTAGERQVSDVEDFIAELPAFVWPEENQ